MAHVLQNLVAAAMEDGWAVGTGSINQIRLSASVLKWAQVPVRLGDPALAVLRPVKAEDAPPSSLSAKYGTGAQPLHTDGAHFVDPPDFVVLMSETVNNTPTLLFRVKPYALPDYARHGVFLVVNGRDSFYSTVHSVARVRYDPGCMVPCDVRAKKTVQYFDDAINSAVQHVWDRPNSILLICNRIALHARASADDDPEREIHRISFRVKKEVQ